MNGVVLGTTSKGHTIIRRATASITLARKGEAFDAKPQMMITTKKTSFSLLLWNNLLALLVKVLTGL